MQIFKLKKGGETENVKETVVVLTRDIDKLLLMGAINIVAKNDPKDVHDIIDYLKEQFANVDMYVDDVETFYY